MTKQEEIREGILNWLLCSTNLSQCKASSGADSILRKLHSQGVVIKVDRELPKVCNKLNPIARADEQQDMLKAGYIAVEPLVEVCEHDWIKLRNKAITSGEICTKCKAIRPESVEP